MFQFVVVVAGLLATSVAAEAQLSVQLFDVKKRVYLVGKDRSVTGTAFRICKPDLILTATHVLDGIDDSELRVTVLVPSPRSIIPTKIKKHPDADVAALFINEADKKGLECFNLGVPSSDYPGQEDYFLAEEVGTFGFPTAIQPLRQRFRKGYIQAKFKAEGEQYTPYKYSAYELSFSSFRGMSGSPVFREHNRNSVIAVVAANYGYWDKKYGTREDWTTGVALPPLADWLNGLARTPGP